MQQPMFERDILYPTGNLTEPGSIHVAVLKPDNEGMLPVIITSKSDHDPKNYIDTLIGIIQADIFDRTRIDIRNQGVFYLTAADGGYLKIYFQNGKPYTEKAQSIG